MMKNYIAISFFSLLLSSAAIAADDSPQGPRMNKGGAWIFDTYTVTAKRGNWTNKNLWQDGNVPSGLLPRANIIGGATVTLNTPLAFDMSFIYMGVHSDKKVEFTLDEGAKLAVGGIVMPGPVSKGSSVDIFMRGGELTVGDIKDERFNGCLNIGWSPTVSGTGRFIISGGKLSAGLRVGTDAPGTNDGTFSVRGTLPTVASHQGTRPGAVFMATGTLEFIFDEKGVSALDCRKSYLHLNAQSRIIVDASAYRGSAKAIPLALFGTLKKADNIRTEITGLPPGAKGEIVFEKNRIVLKLSK